jgi:hypothetical protein
MNGWYGCVAFARVIRQYRRLSERRTLDALCRFKSIHSVAFDWSPCRRFGIPFYARDRLLLSRKSGVRPIYPSAWSAAQCRALESFRLLVGLALIPLWGSFLFISPSLPTNWPFGYLDMIFIIVLLMISNAWVLLLIPRNWGRFGAVSRSFWITITFLAVWWGAIFTATGWMFVKASVSPPMHAISGVYASQNLPPLARTAS